jgi:hypothetical protein
MAGKTPHLNLAYFDFSDKLDYGINVQKEVDRFTTIDKQLYGLYSVFGDGVISGWDVFDNGTSTTSGISIGITPGLGIISNIASQTVTADFINQLSTNTTFYVYAIRQGGTLTSRIIDFIVSVSELTGTSTLKIASITTSSDRVLTIDNNVRTNVSFQTLVDNAINTHKHRGIPSKIDLTTETKNQLSGARLKGFDANKLTSGQLSKERIPLLDHNDLTNKGILSHAQLDTFAQALPNNQKLLGEIATVNQLKQITFLKYRYPTIDQFFDNEMTVIPGISNDALIDYNASTAYIRTSHNSIVGLPTMSNATYFFTNNFVLPDRMTKLIFSEHSLIPHSSTITYGVNSTNSTTFSDYTTVLPDTINTLNLPSNNFRFGIKFLYNSPFDPFDPYSFTFEDFIDFGFINEALITKNFHFRIRWFYDEALTLPFPAATAFSQSDQTNWIVNDIYTVPPAGYPVAPSQSISISYFPNLMMFTPNQIYFVVFDIWDGSSFSSYSSGYKYFTNHGSNVIDPYIDLPQVFNFSMMFEMNNNQKTQLNV